MNINKNSNVIYKFDNSEIYYQDVCYLRMWNTIYKADNIIKNVEILTFENEFIKENDIKKYINLINELCNCLKILPKKQVNESYGQRCIANIEDIILGNSKAKSGKYNTNDIMFIPIVIDIKKIKDQFKLNYFLIFKVISTFIRYITETQWHFPEILKNALKKDDLEEVFLELINQHLTLGEFYNSNHALIEIDKFECDMKFKKFNKNKFTDNEDVSLFKFILNMLE